MLPQIRKLISQEENSRPVPMTVLLHLLQNTLASHDILCYRGPAQQAALDVLANVHLSVQPLLERIPTTEALPQRDEDESPVEVKDEAASVDLSPALSDADDETLVEVKDESKSLIPHDTGSPTNDAAHHR